MQLDERLEQLGRNEQELREQSHGLLARQVPTGSTAIALAAVFVVGILLLALGVFSLPPAWSGAVYWTVSAVGLVVAGGAVLLRYVAGL